MLPGTIQKGLVDTGKRKLITGQDAAGWGLESMVLRGPSDEDRVKRLSAHVCVHMGVDGGATFSCPPP